VVAAHRRRRSIGAADVDCGDLSVAEVYRDPLAGG
jgi:hypothetical protein